MCTNPLTLKSKSPSGTRVHERVVPCGKCPDCVKKAQSGYVVRCIEAAREYGSMCFITLTYKDSRLPATDDGLPTLRREDLKNWKKEFRKKISNKDFAWMLCGEYGPRTGRPHYHGVICGLSKDDLKIAERCWSDKYGFTVFKNVSLVSVDGHDNLGCVARYIAKYVVKLDECKPAEQVEGLVESPRVMTSVGFGFPKDENYSRYILALDKFDYDPFDERTIASDVIDTVIDRMCYQYNGFRYSIPRYFLKKIAYEKNYKGNLQQIAILRLVSAAVRSKNERIRNAEFEKISSGDDWSKNLEALDEYNRLQEVNIESRKRAGREDILKGVRKSVF
jgi:hypothetical protein